MSMDYSKNFYHSNMIIERAKEARNIIVVGAGYIGVEHAEAFRKYISYKGIKIK